MKRKINDLYFVYKYLIVYGGAVIHLFYTVLDATRGIATVSTYIGRLTCVVSVAILLYWFKKEKYQWPILITALCINLFFMLYYSKYNFYTNTGIIEIVMVLSVFPLTLKRYIFAIFLSLIFFVLNTVILIRYHGPDMLTDSLVTSGSFLTAIIIFYCINKYRELLASADKLIEGQHNNLRQKNALLVDTYEQLVHDVKSPLTALKFLSNKSDKEGGLLGQATDRVEKIILDLKNESEVENESIFNIIEKLDYLIDELKIRYQGKCEIIVSITNSLQTNVVSLKNINIIQVSRIISNLLNNSVEACDKIKSEININLSEDISYLNITISDNGPGISEEQIKKVIVQKYTTKPEGMGIGLSTAKNVVEKSGGTFKVHPGKGFKIDLRLFRGEIK